MLVAVLPALEVMSVVVQSSWLLLLLISDVLWRTSFWLVLFGGHKSKSRSETGFFLTVGGLVLSKGEGDFVPVR